MPEQRDDQEKSLWRHTAADAPVVQPLEEDLVCDVLVIGGGYTGMSTALHLAEAGVNTVLLEAKEVGHGGSGRNAGLVNAGVWVAPEEVEKKLGQAAGEKLNNALKFAPTLVFDIIKRHEINCDAFQGGTLYLANRAAKSSSLQDRCRQMNARGAETYVVSGVESQRLSGSKLYRHGGLVDPQAGTIQPLSYARGLAKAAIDMGARLYQNAPVTALQRSKDTWHAITNGGRVTAEVVIMATNAYSDAALPGAREATIPMYIFHVATAPLPKDVAASIVPERHGAWDTRLSLTSTRIDRDDRLVISTLGNLQQTGAGMRRAWVTRLINRLYPQIGGVKWAFEWTGRIGYTVNNLPRLHQPGPNLYLPLGYNGRGIGPGTALGKACAALAQSGNVAEFPLPLFPFKAEPFRKPYESYLALGTLAYQAADQRL